MNCLKSVNFWQFLLVKWPMLNESGMVISILLKLNQMAFIRYVFMSNKTQIVADVTALSMQPNRCSLQQPPMLIYTFYEVQHTEIIPFFLNCLHQRYAIDEWVRWTAARHKNGMLTAFFPVCVCVWVLAHINIEWSCDGMFFELQRMWLFCTSFRMGWFYECP